MVSEWLKGQKTETPKTPGTDQKMQELTARKEAEKVLRIDLDKYDAYEWGTRVKLIEKHPTKGRMPEF